MRLIYSSRTSLDGPLMWDSLSSFSSVTDWWAFSADATEFTMPNAAGETQQTKDIVLFFV